MSVIFKEEIASATLNIIKEKKEISTSNVVKAIKPLIVEQYDNSDLYEYKKLWLNRINNTLDLMKITFVKNRADWEDVWVKIIEKKSKNNTDCSTRSISPVSVTTTASSPKASSSTASSPEASSSKASSSRASSSRASSSRASSSRARSPKTTSSRATSSSKATSSSNATSSSVSSTSTVKGKLLTQHDKDALIAMFNSLDESKMWKLKSDTVVEKELIKFALSCNYEHFTTQIKDYLDLQKKDNLESLLKEDSDLASPTDEACQWLRETLLTFSKLFRRNYLPLTDQSEGDLLRRLWFFIDTVYDTSKINCRGGEKSSISSSISRNQNRTISSIDKMDRKLVGRKLDMVFRRQNLEYGFAECGRFDNGTKGLNDGGFKMPKIMKDMLYILYDVAPDSLRSLCIPGFLLLETKFTLLLMDAPVGYVCRISHLNSLLLPEEEEDISRKLLPILEIVYQMMENTNTLIRHSTPLATFDNPDRLILPSFHSVPRAPKRKIEECLDEE